MHVCTAVEGAVNIVASGMLDTCICCLAVLLCQLSAVLLLCMVRCLGMRPARHAMCSQLSADTIGAMVCSMLAASRSTDLTRHREPAAVCWTQHIKKAGASLPHHII